VTVVLPTGKVPPFVKPAVGLVTGPAMVGVEQASVAAGFVQLITPPFVAKVRSMAGGQKVNVGGVVSVAQALEIVTVKEHVALLLLKSVAV
jgi:hypothetical protein